MIAWCSFWDGHVDLLPNGMFSVLVILDQGNSCEPLQAKQRLPRTEGKISLCINVSLCRTLFPVLLGLFTSSEAGSIFW